MACFSTNLFLNSMHIYAFKSYRIMYDQSNMFNWVIIAPKGLLIVSFFVQLAMTLRIWFDLWVKLFK